jgi:large subunit ribosomal protein L23
MAFFKSKKQPEKKAAPASGLGNVLETISTGAGVTPKKLAAVQSFANVIRRPRLTEKAATLSGQNIYTFDVLPGATKGDIVRTVRALYKVTPVRVNVVNVRGKRVSLRTRRGVGVRNRTRKAYVFLKKGDTIDFAA